MEINKVDMLHVDKCAPFLSMFLSSVLTQLSGSDICIKIFLAQSSFEPSKHHFNLMIKMITGKTLFQFFTDGFALLFYTLKEGVLVSDSNDY